MCRKGRKGERREGGGLRAGHRPARRAHLVLLSLPLLLSLPACGYYSFTGAALPDHLNTIAIPLAVDRAAAAVPDLDQQLTEALIQRFVRQTRLQLVSDTDEADALLEAIIASYRTSPVAVTGDEVAALTRVTVAVDVLYTDRVEDEERLARTFTATADFDATAGGLDAETAAALEAIGRIADDVFTASTSDW